MADTGTTRSQEKRPYKVVYEAVTQEKKPFNLLTSYSTDPPPGFTFVPLGAPELAEYCRELSRKQGLDVFVVSDGPRNGAHKDPLKISHHIHRIGHHFANEVVDKACKLYEFQFRRPATAESSRFSGEGLQHRPQRCRRRLDPGDNSVHRGFQPRQIAESVRELFPEMPSDDVQAVVQRAFEKGSGRVGTVSELSVAGRIQLAVLAHIRHTYTHYDFLLKCVGYTEARQKIESICLERLIEWRGEEQGDNVTNEEAFREIIIIDDENGSDPSDHEDNRLEATGEQLSGLIEPRSKRRRSSSSGVEIVSYQRRSPQPEYIRHANNIEVVSVPPRREINARRFVENQNISNTAPQDVDPRTTLKHSHKRKKVEKSQARRQRRERADLPLQSSRGEHKETSKHVITQGRKALQSKERRKSSRLAAKLAKKQNISATGSNIFASVEDMPSSHQALASPVRVSEDVRHDETILSHDVYNPETNSFRALEIRTRPSAMRLQVAEPGYYRSLQTPQDVQQSVPIRPVPQVGKARSASPRNLHQASSEFFRPASQSFQPTWPASLSSYPHQPQAYRSGAPLRPSPFQARSDVGQIPGAFIQQQRPIVPSDPRLPPPMMTARSHLAPAGVLRG